MNVNTFITQENLFSLRTKSTRLKLIRSAFFLTCLSLGVGLHEAEAKFPLNVFKGVTDSFQESKKYMSPTLGIAALDTGIIGDIRFYGNFTPAYRASSTGGQERDYANDQSKDPIWQMVRILFPSTAGQLSADSTHLYNFGKYVKNTMTVALLLHYANDLRSNKKIDEESLKNSLMESLGFSVKEKMTDSQKMDLVQNSLENDQNLINTIMAESQQAIDDLEAYRAGNTLDQKILGEGKNNLLRKLTASTKNIKNETVKSLFMEKIQELYKIGSYDFVKPDSLSHKPLKSDNKIRIPNPKEKKSSLDPDFFYRVKNALLTEKDNAEEILKNTSAGNALKNGGTKAPKQTFVDAFKNNTLTPLLSSIKKAIMDEQSGQDTFYPKYMPEQIISAFFSYKFSTREDIQHLLIDLQTLDPQLINDSELASFKPKDLLTQEQLPELAKKPTYSLDDIFALLTADIWSMPTPYRVGAPILSNGNTKKYNRATDSFFNPEFADCVETSIRHLINCFLFDPIKRDFDFSGLAKYQMSLGSITPEQKNIFAAFKDFYAKQTVNFANEGSISMRSLWNRVVGDLNRSNEPSTSAIRYRQQNNELDAGFINLMKIFHKIIGVKIDVIPSSDATLGQKKEWLRKSFKTIFETLNPNVGYSIHLNMDKIFARGDEISGNMTVTVKNKKGDMLYCFDFSSDPNRHGQFENYQVNKDLQISDYGKELVSSNFKGVGAENVIWLLSRDAQLRSQKEEKSSLFYQLYTEGLSDNNAKIRFLENIENSAKDIIPIELLNTILKNVISDLNLEDSQTLGLAAPVLLNLSRNERFKKIVKESMRVVKLGENYTFDEKSKKESIEIICMALRENNPISSLDFTKNYWNEDIDSEDAIALAEALKGNTTLNSLSLAFNSVGPKGILALVDALKTNSTLSSLNLGSTGIGPEGVEVLAEVLKTNTSISSLSIAANRITFKDLSTLLEVLKTKNDIVSLDFSNNNIGPEGAKVLAEILKANPSMAFLGLAATNIGDEGIIMLAEVFKKNTSLTNLDLFHNKITSKGAIILAESLKKMANLSSLILSGNSIGDEGVIALAKILVNMKNLSNLQLAGNGIGIEGAMALAENLKNNKSLKTLVLETNGGYAFIGDKGAMALGELLEANSILRIELGKYFFGSSEGKISFETRDSLEKKFGDRIKFS